MQESYETRKIILQRHLASIIKKHRLEIEKSMRLLAAEIGLSRTMWGDLERAIKDPQLSTLWRVAEALEISLSQLVLELEEVLGKDFSLID